MMEQARQAYKQGRYPEAIRLLETQMAQAPEERTRLMLARAYEKNGQLNEARISYEALLRSSDAQIIRWAEQGLNGLLGDAIPFEALQEYCRSAPGAIAFRLKDTRVWLDENGLKIESGPSLDPAMTFPFRDLQPIIRKEDLKPIEGNAYFRVLHGQDQQLLPFETMARTVFAIPTDLPSRLVRKKLLRPEGLARLQSDIRLGETFGAALLRLNLSTLPQLIEATIGSVNLPQGYRRPFNERIGMRLAQNKQPLLKQALSQQAADPQPLGTLLLSLGIPHPKLEEALKTQAPLQGNPSLTDTPEMWLVRWGRPREDRDPRFLQRAQSVRTLLHRELLAGKHRLGNLLVEKGLISPAQLANALAWQVDQPYPLGELLAMHRVCAPEQIIESLLEQQARYRQDAEAALPPMVAPKP